MDFTYNEDELQIQGLANKIFQEQVTADSHKKLEDTLPQGGECFDADVWGILAEAGLLSTTLKEEHGGMGFGFTELCLVIEEAGRVLAPVPLISSTVSALTIQAFGNDALKGQLADTATGKMILTAALAEGGVQDPTEPFAKATQNGDSWSLSGTKLCVPYASVANLILVSAATDKGAALFAIDPKQAGVTLNSLSVTTHEPNSEMVMDSAAAVKLGDSNALSYLIEHYTAAICAYQLGCTDTAMRMTAKYVGEREQFGVKIGTFQAVGHRAADCFIDIGCLRVVTQQAISLLNEGRDASTAVRVAKTWAGDVSHRVSYASQHLHGGFGVDRDYSLWRYAVWCKQNEIYLGNSTFHLSKIGQDIANGRFDIS
jgi:alkylation response protein AidB-like acyl-CoA dehydrogenase